MPVPSPPSDQAIPRVREEIEARLAGVLATTPSDQPVRVEIGESFEMWNVGIVRVNEDRTLAQLATPMYQYHHQIYVNDAPTALAWSSEDASGNWRVPTIARTWLPGAIDRAITVIDGNNDVPAASVTRLLRAPAYGVWSFWFVSPDREQSADELIYVVAAPRDRVYARTGLLMPAQAFVRELGKERPIQGVPPSRPNAP